MTYYAIKMIGTRYTDGNYSKRKIAEEMLGFYRAGWPGYRFEILESKIPIRCKERIAHCVPIIDSDAADRFIEAEAMRKGC
ncbi:hypothetical protein EN02_011810 [Vibrio parahaemolyticus]|nr:hypothetical protein EN02_011810 [Vibrio parahaemolyticus]